MLPKDLKPELKPIAAEVSRIHESAMWSAQGQFEQMKYWRAANLILGLPAAVLAAISGGAGLAERNATATPAILALVAAGFGAALTTLNPSRRVSQAQASANAYMELQTAARQLLAIKLVDMDKAPALAELETLTAHRDEINKTADPPGWYAYWRARRSIGAGRQSYDVDEGGN